MLKICLDMVYLVLPSFCEGLKATRTPMKILKDVAKYMGAAGEELQGRSDFPLMRMDMSMLNDFIDVQKLPKMFRKLNEQVISGNSIKNSHIGVLYNCVVCTLVNAECWENYTENHATTKP